ncbi:hypothetical protein CJF42_03360 [Pseudoalteromonas sp. NBT06-2]|uniref:hypothetical protein n=1 Tax=Pseudoalteromonas sp. NBT06-2 TaxID=2025950 RepID=UPI000BA6BD2D|nr:hypothetical protein [Pseudoalteromonas sp. NBT06-2]PAJ75768.1 hypothetical protein CJF42_03360 [Pseudoalteromonas sp. NBT06-2]
MFIKQYINNWLTNVIAVTFLTLALLSLGNAEYFDRIFIVYLIGVASLNTKSVNILTIISILMFERLIEELVFFFNALYLAKLITYILSMFFIRYFWYDSIVKRLILPVIIVSYVAEVFWYKTGYESPRINFYIGMIWLNIITRHLLFLRVPITQKVISKNVSQTSLDWQLYSLSKWNIIVIVLMLTEYMIRHLTSFSPLSVYHSYPYTIQLLSVATLFFITNFAIQLRFKINA